MDQPRKCKVPLNFLEKSFELNTFHYENTKGSYNLTQIAEATQGYKVPSMRFLV
jgi:hypothetical protein